MPEIPSNPGARAPRAWLAYLIIVAATAAAIALRSALSQFLDQDAAFLVFVLAVAFSAWYAGLGAGLVSTGLCVLADVILFGRGPVSSSEAVLHANGLALFVATGVVLSGVCQALRRAHREAERRAREAGIAQATLHTLLDHVPVGITMAGGPPDFPIVATSKLAAQWLGQPQTAVIGMGAGEHAAQVGVYRADATTRPAPQEVPLYRATRHGATAVDEDWVIRRPDGSAITICVNAVPIRDAEGAIVGGINCWRDVTEQRRWERNRDQVERTLRTQNQRLQLLSEATAHLLRIEDPGAMAQGLFEQLAGELGVDVYLNYMLEDDGALRLHSSAGVPEEALAGMRRIVPGDGVWGSAAQRSSPLVESHIQQSDDPLLQPLKALGLQAYACNPLRAHGELLGTFAFGSRSRKAFDPDELELFATLANYLALAYERLRLIERLRAADRRKDAFLATLAHELRNPLAPIRNAVQLMQLTGAAEPALQAARDTIDRQLQHMVRLIDDLFDVSRITRNRLDLHKQPLELAEVIGQAIETARPHLLSGGHELQVEWPAAPVRVLGDATRLTQVFSNLLNNACKYTEPGGRIRLAARQDGNWASVSVQDTGIGIAPEHLPRVFEMFSQAAPALHRAEGGLGIGLALVRGLTELHGGQVEARSAGLGRGSEFVVRLPVLPAYAPQHAQPQPAHDPPPAPAQGCRILVADDNVDGAASLAALLEINGYTAYTAHDGLEAVQAVERLQPDAVLLDIGMPKLDGYEAARRIRGLPWARQLPLIAVTGWGQEEDRRHSAGAGFDAHLVKPVGREHLLHVLGQLVQRRRSLSPDEPSRPA
jgi:signal transduction histidine kinase/PAS domain-containing protein/ActR/RegA family two-component response regulator